MAINYNPFSQFNVEPSSFSFSDQGMNPMMQPVSILGQQSFGTPQFNFRPVTEDDLVGTDGMSASQIVDMINQPDYETPAPPAAEPQSRILDFGQGILDLLKRDTGLFDVNRIGTAADDLLGSAMRNLTPVEDRRFANNEPFGKTFTDTFAITRPDGTKFYPDEINQPAGIPMGPQTQESISPFLQSPDTPSGLGGPLLAGFNMVNEAAREPNAPMGRDATRAMLQERFGAPTINEILDLPSGQGLGMRTDEQGRMISQEDSRAAFDQASLDRLARLEERDLLQGETLQERDTRLAKSRTEGAGNVPLDVLEAINTPASRRSLKQIRRISKWESSEQGKAMGGVSGLIEERDQFNPRVVEIDGVKLIQLSPTYFQPVRPEPSPGEDFVPRRETVEGFTYLEVSPNKFERVPAEPNPNPDGVTDPLATGTTNKLDEQTARAILIEAGGDVEEARRIAKERGFVL